jgi:hypothetical protein
VAPPPAGRRRRRRETQRRVALRRAAAKRVVFRRAPAGTAAVVGGRRSGGLREEAQRRSSGGGAPAVVGSCGDARRRREEHALDLGRVKQQPDLGRGRGRPLPWWAAASAGLRRLRGYGVCWATASAGHGRRPLPRWAVGGDVCGACGGRCGRAMAGAREEREEQERNERERKWGRASGGGAGPRSCGANPAGSRSSISASLLSQAEEPFLGEVGTAQMDRAGLPNTKK